VLKVTALGYHNEVGLADLKDPRLIRLFRELRRELGNPAVGE
jgi:hypothetical protein